MNSGPDSTAVPPTELAANGVAQPLAREVDQDELVDQTAEPSASEAPEKNATPADAATELESLLEAHLPHDSNRETQPQRYLGGDESVVAFRPQWPAWFRVFLIGVCLAINFAGLCALLLYPVAGNAEQPDVRCLVADAYDSAGIPSIDFATHDVARVLNHKTIDDISGDDRVFAARDVNDIRSFFESQLSDGREDTPFVGYIVAHGFGDENGARLLPVETVSVTEETGYSIETLLDSIAESNKKCIVLLLECSHFQSNLRLGVQTNEFADQLPSAFDQRRSAWHTDARFHDRSILIVSSTSGYQPAATSNRLSGSPFALSAAYGL
ncbi:MAG: hypothetical protein AB8G99_27055, partial [Planctomycetaceae bacterium]